MTRLEYLAQFKQQVGLCFPVANVEERRQVLIELSHRQSRVEKIGHHHRTIEALHHPAQHRCLAGSDLAGHHDQALAAFDAVVKIGHHFRMRRGEVNEARVGCQREWQFRQSIKFDVHVESLQIQAFG